MVRVPYKIALHMANLHSNGYFSLCGIIIPPDKTVCFFTVLSRGIISESCAQGKSLFYGSGCGTDTKRAPPQRSPCSTGNFLSSQSVSRQVLSASECLTTVFGMGTGGTIQASSPDILFECLHIQNYTEETTLRTFQFSS